MKNQEKGFGKFIFPGDGAWAEVLRDPPEPHFLEKSRKGASKPNFPGARAWAKALRDSRTHHFIDKSRKRAFSAESVAGAWAKALWDLTKPHLNVKWEKGAARKLFSLRQQVKDNL